MREEKITLINKLGLHARATAKLIGVTTRFTCRIQMGKIGGKMVDAKSIMSVMLLAASNGTELQFMLDGEDEAQAWEAIAAMINDRFEEGE
ncbi:HPr family phosphocarrier protein [Pokkaliibacter sp. MBI-7]|uniref:HPr family phosphocarrier protein n=1 Tax=Proteobacteria bacterium 228 TaxID=2083153 RepID=A0A2S5KJ09_9PROT|nr:MULTISPECIES: HPr family phosphocarrier protein [Pokkaliibacter]MDH2431669.1 HPr family phosphocarrier protein [Pokkaliibacter sp. MBI-7]PPC74768.1 HPr family phosphocarrier protein [Pokkaliibacter plantistimulans]